jgi:hypothetical protein
MKKPNDANNNLKKTLFKGILLFQYFLVLAGVVVLFYPTIAPIVVANVVGASSVKVFVGIGIGLSIAARIAYKLRANSLNIRYTGDDVGHEKSAFFRTEKIFPTAETSKVAQFAKILSPAVQNRCNEVLSILYTSNNPESGDIESVAVEDYKAIFEVLNDQFSPKYNKLEVLTKKSIKVWIDNMCYLDEARHITHDEARAVIDAIKLSVSFEENFSTRL